MPIECRIPLFIGCTVYNVHCTANVHCTLFRKLMEAEQDKARRRLQELADNLNAMQKNVQDVSTVYVHCRTIHHLKSKKMEQYHKKYCTCTLAPLKT
jgi:hypothetical protein